MKTSELPPRERIITAAVSVFAADGYDAGSLNDVAASAGMSRHNLLYYFPSKRELLLGVLDSRDARVDRRLQWMEASSDLTLAEFADGLTALWPDIYDEPALMQLYHRLATEAGNSEHPAHEWVAARYVRIRLAIRKILAAAVLRGELDESFDIDGLSIALLGAIEGIETQWLVSRVLDWKRATAALRALVLAVVHG